MALRPCKECGKEISTRAESCPNCGAKQPKPTSAFTWVIASFLLLIGFTAFRLSVDGNNAAPASTLTPGQRAAADKASARKRAQETRERHESALAYACRDWVKKSLHDPESAKFEDSFALRHEGDIDRIQVRARARNAFNALRLSTFECRIRSKGDKLTLVGIAQLP